MTRKRDNRAYHEDIHNSVEAEEDADFYPFSAAP